MQRSLLSAIIGMVALWLILDDIYGKGRITSFVSANATMKPKDVANAILPGTPYPNDPNGEQKKKATDKAKDIINDSPLNRFWDWILGKGKK